MSYRKKHVKSKVHRITPKKSIFKKLWFWILILLIAAISTAAYFVFFYSGFQLKNIVISGNSKVATKDLQDIVSEYSNTGLIDFASVKIVSRSIFLIDEAKISSDILKTFPDIDTLKISKSLPQTLTLRVIEREPIGVFCDSRAKCFLIDQSGFTFEPVSVIPADTTIVRQALEGGQVFSGEQVINQSIMSAIYNIQKAIKDDLNINLKEALVASSSRLNITTSANWQAYFDLSPGSDIDSQISKLNSLLSNGISADDMKNLRYIDLRPKDRAIVCDNKTCGG